MGIKELVRMERKFREEEGMTSADIILAEGRKIDTGTLLRACNSRRKKAVPLKSK